MAIEISRVVTDRNAEGKSVFLDLEEPHKAAAGGMDIANLWGTADGVAQLKPFNGNAEPVLFPFFPGPGATRLCVVYWPPESVADADGADEADQADPNEAQPGLLDVFEADEPGFHTTASIDYGLCISGEIYLELDDGAERLITPGTFVVQRGTRHAWRNRSNDICVMMYVLVGAQQA